MSKPKLDAGLEYFPLDVHFINDDKVQSLIYEIGYSQAISLLITLYSMIYENNYYLQLDKSKYKILSVRLNIDPEQLKLILNSCCEYSIFNEKLYKEYEILTSKRIQLTYIKAAKRRKEIPIFLEYKLFEDHCLVESEIDSIKYISIHQTHYSGSNVNTKPTTAGKMLQNTDGSPQSKVKEKKRNKSKGDKGEKSHTDNFVFAKSKIQNFANISEVNNFLKKYDINLEMDFLRTAMKLVPNQQLLEFIALDRDKPNLQERLENRIKSKVSSFWYHFVKKYPNKTKILDAKDIFLSHDKETQTKILDSIQDYTRDTDGKQYAKKAIDYLDSEIWRDYAV